MTYVVGRLNDTVADVAQVRQFMEGKGGIVAGR